MYNNLSHPITGAKTINNVVVGEYGMEILNCASALCQCGHSLGIPEEELTDEPMIYHITCPNCGFQISFTCSERNVWRGFDNEN